MERKVLQRELAGAGLALFSVFLIGALFFQWPSGDDCWAATGPFGPVGTISRCVLVASVGIPGMLVAGIGCMMVALALFDRLGPANDASDWAVFSAGIIALMPIAVGLAAGGVAAPSNWAGLWGSFAAHYLRKGFGAAGAWIAFLLVTSALTVLTVRWNPIRVLVAAKGRRNIPTFDGEELAEDVLPSASSSSFTPLGSASSQPHLGLASGSGTGGAGGPSLAEALAPEPEELPMIEPASMHTTPSFAAGKTRSVGKSKSEKSDAKSELILNANDELAESSVDLPPLDLLTAAVFHDVDAGNKRLDQAGEQLMAALRTFKVDGELVGRTTGPSVTQFEIEPAAGVKVRQIAALADDLALAMRAPSIRIVAPIPGRGAVGVEVPNPVPQMVVLREVLESPEYLQARAALPIALGKDLEGRSVVADLARMPHLLIAGATGSGKSVCVNTIITSLVYRHTPRTLRFLMIDPKMVELSVYNALPHKRHKVITDNRDAASVLKWAVFEMQDRYRLLEANGCRNLQDFNRRVTQAEQGQGAALVMPRNPEVAFENREYKDGILPYIVVVIDEMADLMMTVQGEVETPIAQLAQKARAIGIHLILATQRPSVNVITGLIKANFPCRIAFRVASQVDSRTIIDGAGAETLLGNGDMLFIPPGKSEAVRLQGAYLSSEDTEKLLGWYAQQAERVSADAASDGDPDDQRLEEPDILEKIRAIEAAAGGGTNGGGERGDSAGNERDELFREAAEVVLQHRQGSTSLLQRKLRIGYSRAARIIDQLEEAGVLSPSEGAVRPREVLIGAEDLDRICKAKL